MRDEGRLIFLLSDGKSSVLTEQAAGYSYRERQKWLQELCSTFKTIDDKKKPLYRKC